MSNSASSSPLETDEHPELITILHQGTHQASWEKSFRYRVGNRTCTLRCTANFNGKQIDKLRFEVFDLSGGDEASLSVFVCTERDNKSRSRWPTSITTTYAGNVAPQNHGGQVEIPNSVGGHWFTLHRPFEDHRILLTMQELLAQPIQSLRQGLNFANVNAMQLQSVLMALQRCTSGLVNNVGGLPSSNMGINASSGPLVIEDDPLYVLQDAAHRFSKEKSIRYRVGCRTCTIRVSANYNNNQYCDKINFVLFDFCDGDEARVDLCVGTERASTGSSRFGSISSTCEGEVATDNPKKNQATMSYGCLLREGLMIVESNKEALHISHNYFVIDRDQCLTFFMEIQCDRTTGLSFTIHGPFEEARNLRTMQNLHSERIRILRGGLNFNSAWQLQSALMALQGSTSGLINTVGSTTNGNYNGSVNITNNYYSRDDEVSRN